MKEVVIVSAVRTPIGAFLGGLSSIPAVQLGATAIKGALNKINLDPSLVQEVFMGNVLQAGEGQAPARQAALGAGLSNNVPCTTVNKVCASGMKAVMFAAQAIKCGDADIVVAGGMESKSQAPFYNMAGRTGTKFGIAVQLEGIIPDGVLDAYNKKTMGIARDWTATKHKISREEQDAFAIESYTRTANAWKEGKFAEEIVP